MTVLEITVQRRLDDIWPVVLERSQAGELPFRAEGKLDMSTELKLWKEQLLAKDFDPVAYGTLLGQALFRDTVRDAFVTARNESGDDLRTLLVIEDDDLKPLHWERLCAPIRSGGKWGLLGTDQRSIFSLYLPSLADRRFPAIGRRDLRALVLVANPPEGNPFGLDRFDESITVASIRAALGDLPHDLLATVPDAIGRPTLDELAARITGRGYTLLHVVAHGWYDDSSGETTLYLLNGTGQVAPVAASGLVQRLEQIEGTLGLPRLAFLATCESAAPGGERAGALGGLAQRLVRELGLPAVVAMTQKVSVDTATALAREFYVRLRDHGEADRALVQATVGLAGASDITVPALYSRLAGRPLFSDTRDRELTDSEIEYGLGELAKLLPERAPILQETFAAQAAIVRGPLGTDRASLSEASRREWNDALARVNSLCEEVLDLDFRALAFGNPPPPYDPRCPFPGLLAFGARYAVSGRPEEDDRSFFFGREALVQWLRGKLAAHTFLPVLGPSGSGKSSVVLAGLIPPLVKEEPGLAWVSFTPGNDPLAQLDASMSKLLASSGDQPMPVGDSRSANRESRFLLVVDQFEELFTLCRDEQVRRDFLERLLSLTQQQCVIITMRADFWGDCAPYTELRKTMQKYQELIPPMTATELRSAMEQQARAVGLRFEADLSNTILDEVQGEPSAMPLLQHLLAELWARRHGRWLRAEEYRALGGIRTAIAHTADGLYSNLSPDEQKLVRHIFVRLTRLALDQGSDQEHRNTRQRVTLSELVTAGHDIENVRDLVNRLADARLVVANQQQVEVAHEALIRYWPRLQAWIDEDRAAVALRETVQSAAIAWTTSRRPDLLIHRGDQLRAAMSLLDHPRIHLNPLEVRYLETCFQTTRSSFHIAVGQGTNSEWPVVIEYLPREARLTLRFEGALRLDRETYERLEGGISYSDEYGAKLGHALFREEVHSAFVQAWAEKAEHLRIDLTVKDTRLQRLRWENLHAPLNNGQWDFLSTEPRAVYSLACASLVEHTCRPVNRDELRALICVASPIDRKNEIVALDAEEIVTYVRDSLGVIPCDILGRVPGACGPATMDALCEKLVTGMYPIVHIVAHGVFDQTRKTSGVVLEDAVNGPEVLWTNEFVERLKALGDHWTRPLFLYFDAGLSSDLRDTSEKGRLGVRLVTEAGIPAVLAMTREFSLRTSEALTRTFYPRLLEHGEPDLALAEARERLFDFSDIFVPFVYSGLPGHSILLEKNMEVMNRPYQTSDIEITVHQKGDDTDTWPVTTTFRGAERWLPKRSESALRLALEELGGKLADPASYGTLLGQALIHSALGDDIKRELVAGKSDIRIRLGIEAPELKGMQWEWLCLPVQDGSRKFVAATPRISFSRILFSPLVQSPPCLDCDSLKALAIVALPNNLDPTRFPPVSGMAENLSGILKDIKTDTLASQRAGARPPTLASLFEKIDSTQYAILHIVAHAALSKLESEPVLLFEGDQGRVDPIRPPRFLKRLKAARHLPLFVFLMSPYPSDPGGNEALASLARMMIEELGILAAVVMTGTMSTDTNELFAKALYRQLRTHGEIDRAFGEACVEVSHRPDFVPPALYSRLKEVPLFYSQIATASG